jgi:hypothetical protein
MGDCATQYDDRWKGREREAEQVNLNDLFCQKMRGFRRLDRIRTQRLSGCQSWAMEVEMWKPQGPFFRTPG